MAIILRYICWGTPTPKTPPPLRARLGSGLLSREPARGREGGGVAKGARTTLPPPSSFFPAPQTDGRMDGRSCPQMGRGRERERGGAGTGGCGGASGPTTRCAPATLALCVAGVGLSPEATVADQALSHWEAGGLKLERDEGRIYIRYPRLLLALLNEEHRMIAPHLLSTPPTAFPWDQFAGPLQALRCQALALAHGESAPLSALMPGAAFVSEGLRDCAVSLRECKYRLLFTGVSGCSVDRQKWVCGRTVCGCAGGLRVAVQGCRGVCVCVPRVWSPLVFPHEVCVCVCVCVCVYTF